MSAVRATSRSQFSQCRVSPVYSDSNDLQEAPCLTDENTLKHELDLIGVALCTPSLIASPLDRVSRMITEFNTKYHFQGVSIHLVA